MSYIAMIRHGPTEWTKEKRLQGRTDVPLSLSGRQRIRSWQLPIWAYEAHWEASPLKRARETARLLKGKSIAIQHCLAEMSWGDWEGHRYEDLKRNGGEAIGHYQTHGPNFRPPGGESPSDVLSRLRPWLVRAASRRRLTLAVAHKTVMNTLLAHATGWDMTGKPPIKIRWGQLIIFQVTSENYIQWVATHTPQIKGPR